jgi:hypothetical protein
MRLNELNAIFQNSSKQIFLNQNVGRLKQSTDVCTAREQVPLNQMALLPGLRERSGFFFRYG